MLFLLSAVSPFLLSELAAGPIVPSNSTGLVYVTFTATVYQLTGVAGLDNVDPAVFGPMPAIGSTMSGTFVYDLGFNLDGQATLPEVGEYAGAPVSMSVTAGPVSNAFLAQSTAPAGSRLLFYDNFNPGGTPYDGVYFHAGREGAGVVLPGTLSSLTFHWITTILTTLDSDAMQSLPGGLSFPLRRTILYRESDSEREFQIFADLDSYSVSFVETPEPGSAGLLLAGVVLLAYRKVRRAFSS